MKFRVKNLAAIALCCGFASLSTAQNTPAADPQSPADQATPVAAAPAAPTALPTPSLPDHWRVFLRLSLTRGLLAK